MWLNDKNYKDYLICNYSFANEQTIYYRNSYYSFKLDKVMYANKYDFIEPLSSKYIIGVKYKCKYSNDDEGSERICTGQTLDILSVSEEKVVKSIAIASYNDEGLAIKKIGNKYFCLAKETIDSDNCIETYAYGKGIKLLVKGEVDGVKRSSEGNLCVLKNKTLTIYDETGKQVSKANNKKLSDCK